MDEALFFRDGDTFVPTNLTRGGWSDDAQHGSPPAGLLGRAVEQVPTLAPMRFVRFTVDLFSAVPLSPLTVGTQVIKEGKRIQLVEAYLYSDGVQLAKASALRIRIDAPVPELVGNAPHIPPPVPFPEDLPILHTGNAFGPNSPQTRFHLHGVEIRSVDDSFARTVPGRTWFRLRTPLVTGEDLTPFQRAATMSDLANGNAQAIDPADWTFVNPDITLYLHRYPAGEWVAMASTARQHPDGLGITETVLFDRQGPIGHILQSQLIARR